MYDKVILSDSDGNKVKRHVLVQGNGTVVTNQRLGKKSEKRKEKQETNKKSHSLSYRKKIRVYTQDTQTFSYLYS